MEIKSREIQHTFRNKYLKYGGATSNYSLSNSTSSNGISKWFYEDEDGNLHSKLSLIGDGEISAYGAGSSGSGGDVTIIDNLTSTAIDCALSANMGRYLKELIDNKPSVTNVTWANIEGKPAELTDANIANWMDANAKKHLHSNKTVLDGITSTKITDWDNHLVDIAKHITATERTNWNLAYTNNHTHSNKSVIDDITSAKVTNWDGVVNNWNKAFYFDDSNNLRVKLNLVGEGEVSAYGAGDTGGGGGVVTIVDNLTSTAIDCALSANQGRVLKSLIDNSTGGVSSWNDLTDKPTSFTPAAHNHTIANITSLQTTLDGKAAASHTHNYTSTVKVGTVSYNVASNIISLPAYPTTLPASDVSAWAKASSKPSYSWSEIGSKPTTFTPSPHNHTDMLRVWDCSITIGSWSRLCYASNINLGGSFFLTVQYTRDNVVVNSTFLISFGHSNNSSITTLSPYGYSQMQLRMTTTNNNDFYIEILDKNSGSGQQTVRCSASKIDCYLTTYTTYTAGAGTVGASTSTEIGRIKLNNSTIAFLTDNVASATKLATPRTINGTNFDGTANITTATWGTARTLTLAGNASGSVSINGGSNITLNVSNNYASSAGNADTLDTYHETIFVRDRWIAAKSDYQNIVILLWKDADTTTHRVVGKLFTSEGGGNRWQYADINCWHSRWATGSIGVNSDYNFSLNTSQIGNGWRLVTCNYGGATWWALQHTNIQAINIYFQGQSSNVSWTKVHYYTINTATVVNSEVNGSLTNRDGSTSSLCKGGYVNYATVTDNVASATKLAASRSIWGQNFDGTANVSGAMTGVSTINATGRITTSADIYSNSWLRTAGQTGWYSETYGGGWYMTDTTYVRSYNSKSIYTGGSILAAGEVTAYSDARLKSDIKPLENRGYITPVTYTKEGKASIGFIAQDVQKLYPELVLEDTTDNKYLSLNYAQYVAVLQAQIIELNNRIEQLEIKQTELWHYQTQE